MMKKIFQFPIIPLIVAGLFIAFSSFVIPAAKNSKSTTGGLLTFTIRTVTDNGTFSPKHVLAIWVEDADGFVKTRKAMANQRKQYLYTWKAASNYNVIDAITGVTLTSHQSHTVTWDFTDLSGNIVPDGDYTVWVEFTDKHAQGPLYNLTFTKGPEAQSMTPPDETYFKDIQLDFVPYVAEFTANANEICQNESVIFTDQSVGATSWSWNFGPGASPASANTAGPHTVTYSTPGQKTVSLTINGSVTETKQNLIAVNPSPTAEFSFAVSAFTAEFSNGSNNASSYLWDFGDGETSTAIDPVHTYSGAGTYTVSLTATFINCQDVIYHDVSVPIVGINNELAHYTDNVTFYPNPSTGFINVRSNRQDFGTVELKIFNSVGKLIYTTTENLNLSRPITYRYFKPTQRCLLYQNQKFKAEFESKNNDFLGSSFIFTDHSSRLVYFLRQKAGH